MTGGGNSIADTAPPMAHAVGGSLGSALALLLLYPLERARVEMQTRGAAGTFPAADINDKVTPLRAAAKETCSRGGGTVGVHISAGPNKSLGGQKEEGHVQHYHANQASLSGESWSTCLNDPESMGEISPSSSLEQQERDSKPQQSPSGSQQSSSSLAASSSSTPQADKKLGLLACIYQLHRRNQLYRGVTPVVTTMALSNFVFFYCHSYIKQLLELKQRQSSGNARASLQLSLLASSLAGIANVLLTNPLWVANLRIVTSSSNNQNNDNNNHPETTLWKELQSIVHTEGWTHLWNGTPASLLLVSNPVIQFVAYEQLKSRLLQRLRGGSSTTLRPLEAFILGAVAKAISTVLTYPLQLAQTVLRVQKDDDNQQRPPELSGTEATTEQQKETGSGMAPSSTATSLQSSANSTSQAYKGTLDCLLKIYQQKGLEGWFAGMKTKLLQTVLTSAFTFLTYEQILRAIMIALRAVKQGGHIRSGTVPVRAN